MNSKQVREKKSMLVHTCESLDDLMAHPFVKSVAQGPLIAMMAVNTALEHIAQCMDEADEEATPVAHADDLAVDKFAEEMKAKLSAARKKGRFGWNDPNKCSAEYLAQLLADHIYKGNKNNFVDIANLCMMLHLRGAHEGLLPMVLRRPQMATGSQGDRRFEIRAPDGETDHYSRIWCAFMYEKGELVYELYDLPFPEAYARSVFFLGTGQTQA